MRVGPFVYVGEKPGVCTCETAQCLFLPDGTDAHRELYPGRVGKEVYIVRWDLSLPYGIVVKWKGGFRGIARREALSPVPDLPTRSNQEDMDSFLGAADD